MNIKLAEPKDLKEILEIVDDAVKLLKQNNVNQWQNGYPNRDILLNDIYNKTLYVLLKDGLVIGFSNFSKVPDPSYKIIYQGKWLTLQDEYLVVHRIAVRSGYYHTNAAVTLLSFACEYAKENNLKSIRIDTHQDNIPMNKLLQKLGYVRCGIIYLLGYLDADKERVAYEKLL